MAFDLSNTRSLAEIWLKISEASSPMQLAWAKSRMSDPALLELLCSVSDPEVAIVAIQNPAFDANTLDRLAGHSRTDVRLGVAFHGNTNWETVAGLSNDNDHAVASAAAERLVVADESKYRMIAATSRFTSRYALNSLLNDTVPEVSTAAATTIERLDAAQLAAIQQSFEPADPPVDSAIAHQPPADGNEPWSGTEQSSVIELEDDYGQHWLDEPSDHEPFSDLINGNRTQPSGPEQSTESVAGTAPDWVGVSDQPVADLSDDSGGFSWDSSEYDGRQDIFDLLDDADETVSEDPVSTDYAADAIQHRAEQLADDLMARVKWDEGREVLTEALARRNFGTLRVAILREIQKGMQPEELKLALQMREYWKEAWADSGYSMLSWKQTLTLIRGFHGYPDLVEITGFMELAFRDYKRARERSKNFDLYVWAMLDSNIVRKSGHFDPFRFRLEQNGL